MWQPANLSSHYRLSQKAPNMAQVAVSLSCMEPLIRDSIPDTQSGYPQIVPKAIQAAPQLIYPKSNLSWYWSPSKVAPRLFMVVTAGSYSQVA